MRRSALLAAALLLSRAALGQEQNPIDIAIRAAEALAKTAAAADPPGPKPTPTPLPAKEPPPLAVQPDWSSVDAIVTALYASVSHGPEYEPNWKRLRTLFLPDARIVPPMASGAAALAVLDPAAFEARVRRYIEGRRERRERLGFTEREIARRENRFGNVCQVFSTYETRWAPHEAPPFARGVHAILLVDDGRRWWIAALAWDAERPENPIPPELLATEIR
jgi:hypothetical protein